MSATKYVKLGNWPFSIYASLKPGDIAILFGFCEPYPENIMFYGTFLLIRQKPSLNGRGFEKRHSCGLGLCHIISERWKWNKWQIMALASSQSLRGIWMSGRATSFRRPTPVLRWPASHTHTHIRVRGLEIWQQTGSSHSEQTQAITEGFLLFSVVREGPNYRVTMLTNWLH